MTLSVLKGRFPMQACALSQRHSASAGVSMHWCRNVHSLVPKCLGAQVSWGRTIRTLRHQSSGHFGTGTEVD